MVDAREITHDPNEKKVEGESSEELQEKAFAAAKFLKDWVPSALNDYKKTPLSEIEEALSALTRFKEMVGRERAEKKAAKDEMLRRIEEVLDTPRGQAVQKARDVFADFDQEIDIPHNQKAHADEYSIHGDDYRIENIDLDDEDYDPDGVFELYIGHLEVWGDGDFDHGGGSTKVVIKLNTEGKVVYEFTGDDVDPEFKKQIEDLIRKKAETI